MIMDIGAGTLTVCEADKVWKAVSCELASIGVKSEILMVELNSDEITKYEKMEQTNKDILQLLINSSEENKAEKGQRWWES